MSLLGSCWLSMHFPSCLFLLIPLHSVHPSYLSLSNPFLSLFLWNYVPLPLSATSVLHSWYPVTPPDLFASLLSQWSFSLSLPPFAPSESLHIMPAPVANPSPLSTAESTKEDRQDTSRQQRKAEKERLQTPSRLRPPDLSPSASTPVKPILRNKHPLFQRYVRRQLAHASIPRRGRKAGAWCGASPSRGSLLTGTGHAEAGEDPASPGCGSSLSMWPSQDGKEKREAERICLLSPGVPGTITFSL